MKPLARTIAIVFALWGVVHFLNATYPWWESDRLIPAEAAAQRPYTAEDRARDAARARYLHREADATRCCNARSSSRGGSRGWGLELGSFWRSLSRRLGRPVDFAAVCLGVAESEAATQEFVALT
jgi:hypothetical protein